MKESKRFRLGLLDILKGVLVAVLTGGVHAVLPVLNSGSINIDPKATAAAAIAGGAAYITKNFFEDKTRLNDGQ